MDTLQHADSASVPLKSVLCTEESLPPDYQAEKRTLLALAQAFEAAMSGLSLEQSLGRLIRTALEGSADPRAAFYLLDVDGACLHPVAVNEGMPASYTSRVDGFKVGADSLACGLAVALNSPVITPDVNEDPKWAPWLGLAQEFDFRGCWSFPINTTTGKPVGTFALYHRRPSEATPRDLMLAEAITQAAGIIISQHTEVAERQRAEQRLREADRRKDEFLAMLAHELRNPLAAICNAVELLLRANGDARSVRLASEILDRQAKHMVRQVDDLLDISRIERGKLEVRKERTDLAAIVDAAVEVIRPLCESLGHELSVALPPKPLYLAGDQIRLTQAVGNLLNNACKFTDKGGRICLTVEEEGEQAVVRVRDTGIGLAPDQLGRIFELFAQVDSSIERGRDGLGLGLTLVKRLVEMHDGTVEARSAGLGQGSEFVVRLPLLSGLTAPRPSAYR